MNNKMKQRKKKPINNLINRNFNSITYQKEY